MFKKIIGVLAIFWVVGFFVALFAPLNVLTEGYYLGKLCDLYFFDACIFDLKDSLFPEVAAVYFFIVWFSFPFWFLLFWVWMLNQVGGEGGGLIFKNNLNLINKFVLICLLPIWLFLLYVVVVLYGGGDSRLFALGSSRTQLGLWGMVVPASAAALSALVIFTIKRVLKG